MPEIKDDKGFAKYIDSAASYFAIQEYIKTNPEQVNKMIEDIYKIKNSSLQPPQFLQDK